MTEQDYQARVPEFTQTITFYFHKNLGHDPSADQLAAYLLWCKAGATGPQIDAKLSAEPEAVAYRNRPAPPAYVVPSLRISGVDFVTVDGQREVLVGVDQFCAVRQELDSNGAALDLLIQESHELGFNMWRVFSMGSKAQNGILQLDPREPGYYPAVRRLADRLAAAGIVLLLTVYVDNEDIKAYLEHLRALGAALAGCTNVLISGGNEWSKNGFNPGDLFGIGFPWSRGSDVGDALPFRPIADFVEFHPRRDLPKALLDSVASAVEIRDVQGMRVPLIIDEPPRMGPDGSAPEYADPFECWKFARHYSTECAGAVYHSRAGQYGVLMDADNRACAVGFVNGMRL